MRISVLYPHGSESVQVFWDGQNEVWWGPTARRGDEVVYTATMRAEPVPDRRLLCLEPPIVEPWAYERAYRAGFNQVFAFAGPVVPSTVAFRNTIPPLWPRLPEHVARNPWAKRKRAIVAVMGNKYPHRILALRELAKRADQLGLELDVYGRPPFDLPWYRGPIEGNAHAKRRMLERYQYCYCPENQARSYYMTEKLPEALLAGCFPIYDVGAEKACYPSLPWELVFDSIEDLELRTADEHSDLLELVDAQAPAIGLELSTDNLYQTLIRWIREA
jgi:hypothetical protein